MKKLNISAKKLYEGCIISSVAHAVWARKYPFAKYTHYWDNFNCHFNDMEGNIATISFFDDGIIGAIFRHDYYKNQTISLNSEHTKSFLNKMPSKLKKLAETNTLQYFIQPIDDKEAPVVTNIFWSVEDELISTLNETEWTIIWDKLLRMQLMEIENTILELKKNYDLSDKEVKFIEYLFESKIKSSDEIIELSLDSSFEKIINDRDRNTTEELLRRLGILIKNEAIED